MKWLLLILALLALMVVTIVIVGLLLPHRHVATRSAAIRQSATSLFAVARDFAAQPGWRTGIRAIETLPPREGRFCYREVSAHGAVAYVVMEEKPGERLVMKIADDDLPYGGTWTFEFSPDGAATRVRITEDGEVKNPVFRFMARFVFGYTTTMETYLRDLGRKFGENVAIEP